MFGMQLFLAIAIILASGGATTQSGSSLQCAYSDFPVSPFCLFTNWAHEANEKAFNLLVGDFAKNSTQKLSKADGLVQKLLTKKDRETLLTLLKEALQAEVGALVLAKADCYTLSEEDWTSMEQTCTSAFDNIAYAIIKLIEAAMEVVEKTTKTAEFEAKLRQTFSHGDVANHSKNYTNEAYFMGREALTVLW